MAVLTQFPSTKWQITLNRVETSTEASLDTAHITITSNFVDEITGSGLKRVLTLQTAVSSLAVSSITISAHTGMEVVSTANVDLQGYLKQIRNLIWTNLSSTDLPDDTISEDVYLVHAENEVLDSLDLTTSQYNTKAAADSAFAQRVRIAVMYRTAGYLLPAVPQLLREELNREYSQYADVDWKERQTLYFNFSDNSIKDDIPSTATRAGDITPRRWTKRVRF